MLTYKILARRPKQFKSLTGLDVKQFDSMYKKVEEQYQIAELERLSNKIRKRRIGAGRPFRLSVRERFLMLLVHHRCRTSYGMLERLFGVHATTAYRDIKKIEPAVKACMLMPDWKDPEMKKSTTLERLEVHFPGSSSMIRALEQRSAALKINPKNEHGALKKSV